MRSNYEEKRQARIEGYQKRAENAMNMSEILCDKAHKMARAIPMGQPVMGTQDRRYRDKIGNKMNQAIREDEKSKYYAEKAIAAENNKAISSDDPEAIRKLKKKLEAKESEREKVKAANKKARSEGREQAPWYVLPYLGKEIKRIKERIAKLEAMEQMENIKVEYEGFTYIENPEENRIQFVFDGKPDEKTRTILKQWEFKWARTVGAWQRFLNGNSRYAAKCVIAELTK